MKAIKKRIKFEHGVVYLVVFVLIVFTISMVLESKRSAERDDKLRTTPVDVLKDWTLKVDDSKSYKPGDSVAVTSIFTKLVDIKPKTSRRFVQCIKRANAAQAVTTFDGGGRDFASSDWGDKTPAPENLSSASPGKNVRTVDVLIPYALVALPNVCRVNLNPTYNVNEYNTDFPENGYSNPFRVEPREGVSVVDQTTTYVYTDESSPNQGQAMISITPQAGERVIIYQNPPVSDLGEDQSPPRPQRPGFLENLTTPIVRGIEGVLNALPGR